MSTSDYGSYMKGAIRKPCSPGGAWSYRIDLGFDDAGKRRQRQVGNCATKRAAQAALNESYVLPHIGPVRLADLLRNLRAVG